MSRHLRHWLPAIFLAILISIFSTKYFSSEETARVIFPILRWLFPSASHHMLHFSHFVIRKLAHITEFAVFSIAVFHGVRGNHTGWKLNWAIWTLLIAVTYAGLDEWHQSFVPMREPRIRDVMIDGFGSLLAQLMVWVYSKIHRNSTRETDLERETA